MVSAVSRISQWSCDQLEASLLPRQGNLIKKIALYAWQFFKLCIFLPLAATTSLLSCALSPLSAKPIDPPLVAFAKHPTWKKPVKAAPVEIGFASADFQENGPKVHPDTNWGAFYKGKEVGQTPDIWHHPERVLEGLLETGATKYRFSISRDKTEPHIGKFDEAAIQHYQNFSKILIQHGIEPMVTFDHFSHPLYFQWQRPEDVHGFVNFAVRMADALYEVGVRKIITINEPTVVAFQGWVLGKFPPSHKLDFETAARVLENMSRAHLCIYRELEKRYPDLEIGISHDPIRFRHYHKINPLLALPEKLAGRYPTETLHTAFFRLMQTGKFFLKVPFRTNYHFDLGEPLPCDFIGLQYYTDVLLSITGGGSVTRNPEEKLTSYGYRIYPQGLASAIEECRSLNIPIELTEIGIDTGINTDTSDRERIRYFDRIFQVVEKALEEGAQIRSLYLWTLIDNLEWSEIWKVRFGFYSFNSETGEIAPRGAAHWLKSRIAARNKTLNAEVS